MALATVSLFRNLFSSSNSSSEQTSTCLPLGEYNSTKSPGEQSNAAQTLYNVATVMVSIPRVSQLLTLLRGMPETS